MNDNVRASFGADAPGGGIPLLIAICEDTTQDMETIQDLCEKYAQTRGYIMQTLAYPNAEKLLADPRAFEADILLLDIMMPGEEGYGPMGVTLARRLREAGHRGAVIFTTTSVDYYPEGFEVGAVHYLVKPLTYEALDTALSRAIQLIKQPQRMITVPVNRMQLSIPQSQIRYAEVFGRETNLYTTTETLRVLLPLKNIERLLDGDPFLRCYRSYIINMDYVQSVEDDHFLLKGGIQIPMSLRNRQALRERFFAYRLGRIR